MHVIMHVSISCAEQLQTPCWGRPAHSSFMFECVTADCTHVTHYSSQVLSPVTLSLYIHANTSVLLLKLHFKSRTFTNIFVFFSFYFFLPSFLLFLVIYSSVFLSFSHLSDIMTEGFSPLSAVSLSSLFFLFFFFIFPLFSFFAFTYLFLQSFIHRPHSSLISQSVFIFLILSLLSFL